MFLRIFVLFTAVFQDIKSEVIDNIFLPNLREDQVECLDAQRNIKCQGEETLLGLIEEKKPTVRKEGYNSFISQLFVNYQSTMTSLLPSKYHSVTAVRDLWTGTSDLLFDRVFKGTKFGDYEIRTGFFSRFLSDVLYTNLYVPTWKSYNCVIEDHCVETSCFPPVRGVSKIIATYINNTNPYIDLIVLTAAIYKAVDKPFSSHKLTFRLTGGFLKKDNYVTVIYKDSARDYSIVNVRTAYYSVKSDGPLNPTDVCDNIFELPDLGSKWTCDLSLRTKDSSACRGTNEFINLRNNPSENLTREAFISLVVGDKNYNNAISTYLGNNPKSKMYDLWFSERSLFRTVFDDRDGKTKLKSGYLTFEYGDMKCRGPILYDISPGNCTVIYPKIYQIESQEGMNITYLNKVNPLFDFTALTLAAARGRLLENLEPGKAVTLIAKKSDKCQIRFNLLSIEGYKTKEARLAVTREFIGCRHDRS